MRSFLLQPYPFSENWRRKLVVCAGIALFVLLFLAIIQPFGFDELTIAKRWQHAALFGTVTFVIASFCQWVVPRIFPRLFAEEGWRSWKEILFLLFCTLLIGGGNYALMLYLYPQNSGLYGLLRAELITLQVGVFPVCFVVFMKQMTLYRRYAEAARQVTEEIQEEEKPLAEEAAPSEKITLRGDNQKEELLLATEDLCLISSADNYVQVQYRQAGNLKTQLLRGSLKKMEEQLAGHGHFFRCHRMYLVNLSLVTSVSGNAQGLKLHLSGLDEPVPVSRSLTETLKEKLHGLSHSPQNA